MLTKQQLEIRKTGLGGSDVAAALGLSPWKSQLQLWAEKVGKTEQPEQTPAMEWGSRLETPILNKFAENNPHLKVSHAGGTVRSEKHRCLVATPDGFIVDEQGRGGILEVKTSGSQPWDDVPDHYILQAQHYLYVLEREYAYFAVLFNGNEYREYGPFPAVPGIYEAEILPDLLEFWQAVEETTPIFKPTNLKDLTYVVRLNAKVEPMVATEDDLRLINAIRVMRERGSDLELEIERLKLQLAERMGPCMKMVDSEGKSLVTQTEVKDGVAIDAKALQQAEPDIFAKYSKPRKGWRSMRIW